MLQCHICVCLSFQTKLCVVIIVYVVYNLREEENLITGSDNDGLNYSEDEEYDKSSISSSPWEGGVEVPGFFLP